MLVDYLGFYWWSIDDIFASSLRCDNNCKPSLMTSGAQGACNVCALEQAWTLQQTLVDSLF